MNRCLRQLELYFASVMLAAWLFVAPTAEAQSRFSENPANGTNVVGFQAPANITADKIWTLPAADGSANQCLATDGAGNLQWVTANTSATAFLNNGNSFGGVATLGTNDSNRLDFETVNSPRMSIDTSGNVGIGITNPSQKLDVAQNSAIKLGNAYMSSGSSNLAHFAANAYFNGSAWVIPSATLKSGLLQIVDNSLYYHASQTAGAADWATRFMIGSTGNVGIGTTNALSAMHVVGPAMTSFTGTGAGTLRVDAPYGATGNQYRGIDFTHENYAPAVARIASKDNGSGSYLQFGTSNNYSLGITNTAMTIDPTGNIGIGITAPTTPLDISGTVQIAGNSMWTTSNWGVGLKFPPTSANAILWPKGGGSGYARGIGTTSDGAWGALYFSRSTADNTSAAVVYDMVISSSGNVGINNYSPTYKLDVSSAANSVAIRGVSDTSYGVWGNATGNGTGILGQSAGSGYGVQGSSVGSYGGYFSSTNGHGLMGVTSSASGMGTGASNNAYGSYAYMAYGKKAFYGYSPQGGGEWGAYIMGDYGVYAHAYDANGYAVQGYNQGAGGYFGLLGYGSWSLYGNGSTYVAGTYQGSDARLKENVKELSNPIESLMKLKPVSFDWKANTDQYRSGKRKSYGFIAQEIEKVYPNIVKEITVPKGTGGKDHKETLNEKLGKFKTVEYTELIAVLTSGVQEIWRKLQSQGEDVALIKEENRKMKEYLCAKDPGAPFCKGKVQ